MRIFSLFILLLSLGQSCSVPRAEKIEVVEQTNVFVLNTSPRDFAKIKMHWRYKKVVNNSVEPKTGDLIFNSDSQIATFPIDDSVEVWVGCCNSFHELFLQMSCDENKPHKWTANCRVHKNELRCLTYLEAVKHEHEELPMVWETELQEICQSCYE